MQISGNYKNNNISFNSLTKVLKKEVMALPYKDAERLVNSYEKENLIVGYFPDDILKIIKKSSSSKKEISDKIKVFNNSLSKIAKEITDFDKNVINQVQRINIEDFAYKAIVNNAIRYKKSGLRSGYVNTHIKFSLTNNEMEQILNSKEINSTMQNIGVIPPDGKILFSYVGCGTYKNCFKMNLLNKDNEQIIHPKAFVICKDPNLGEKCNQIIKKNIKDYICNIDYENFENRIKTKLYNDANIPENIKKLAVKEISPFYNTLYKNVFIYKFGTVMDDFFDINGIFPEANAALKIRNDLGKKIRFSNMVTPYIYDLKNNYGLAEFADDDIEPTKIMYDLKKYHLCWIDNKDENYSNNAPDKKKIVDYGCFFPDKKYYYK